MSVSKYTCRISLILLAFLALFSGCGKKTLPVPPQTVLPIAITDLGYSLDEQGIKLSWSRPGFSETGAHLKRVEDFELLKAAYPAANFCEGCPLVYNTTISVTSPVPQKFGHSDPTVTWHDQDLRPGYRYFYKVRSKAGWQVISKDSNVVSFTWNTPLAPPTALNVIPGDRRLTINWQAPVSETALPESLAYSVFRSTDSEHFAMVLEKTTETSFTDLKAENGIRYYYQVKAFRLSEGSSLPGKGSQVVSGISKDMTPPSPPLNISRIKTDTGIKLFWSMAPDKDLIGYRIYRRLASTEKPVLLGTVPANTLHYTDEQLPTTEPVWYYSIAAIDQSDPPNESLHSIEVRYEVVQ